LGSLLLQAAFFYGEFWNIEWRISFNANRNYFMPANSIHLPFDIRKFDIFTWIIEQFAFAGCFFLWRILEYRMANIF
jgi:hypothetical protein